MTVPKFITWSPVGRSGVAWNLERFLVGRDSVPGRRYSHHFPTIDVEPDIETLLSQGPRSASGIPAGPAAWQTQRCPLGVSSMTVFPLNLHGGTLKVQENPLEWALGLSIAASPPTPPPHTINCPVSRKINK